MFDSSISSKQFLKALNQLGVATKQSKPAALHNSVQRILARADGFEGAKLDELIKFIAHPPATTKPRRSAASKSKKTRPHSPELLAEIQSALSQALKDESIFADTVDKYAKECGAKTIREAAAEFAASGLPKTKTDAIKLLKSERANRIRTEQKIKESGQARPW